MKFIVTDNVDFINLNIVFLIYVFQTASTYLFFPSKLEFLCANQKRYIYNNITNIVVIISNLSQILVLILFKNFYIYLIVIIIFGILQAYLIAKKTNKLYPFITKKEEEKLTTEEKKSYFKDCGCLMMYRINYVVLTATDSIVISKYLGLSAVGIYSNYVLITNSITNILSTFFDSINASIGNLHAKKEEDKDYFVFKLTNFITVVCFGICAIGIYVLINDFIMIWLGKDYLLSNIIVLVIALNLYTEGIRKILSTYRSAYGLFRQAKFIPIFGAIINIVISVILVQKIGICGVLLGTLISNLITFLWFDPYIIYTKVFKKNPLEYYLTNIWYIVLFGILCYICNKVCGILVLNGTIGFIIKSIICVTIPSFVIAVIYYKTEYGKYLKNIIINFIMKVVKKSE